MLDSSLFQRMVAHRRHLHQHPEVSYKEFETTAYIVEHLQQWGYEVERPLETGCLGLIRAEQASRPPLALRADIDALPIQEEGEHKKDFISKHPGVAHCCGHDMHTANLLGVAEFLSTQRSNLKQDVVLIFQPAEESLPGGGRLLAETGFLERHKVASVFGLHTFPGLPAGEIGVRVGPLMASPNEFDIEIIGRGGHAAAPHETIDPINIASHLVVELQSIVSRYIKPTEPAVVSVTSFHAGTTYNVIPEKVQLKGTVRTFSVETRSLIEHRMREMIQHTATMYGAEATLDFRYGYPAVINDPATTEILIAQANHLVGEDKVHLLDEPIMAGEDFSFYQQRVPGTFFFLGSGGASTGSVYPWHHPKYNADEEAMKTGFRLMSSLVIG